MATTMNKNKVSDMAKDFGLTSKDILSVLSTYEDGSKKPSQVLSADEVNLIFEHLTQKHQVKIESIYAESAPQKKPEPKAAPAPAQNQPKANNAQNQPRNNNNNGGLNAKKRHNRTLKLAKGYLDVFLLNLGCACPHSKANARPRNKATGGVTQAE